MIIAPGSTDVSTYFKLVHPTTGVPVTAATITNLDATYIRVRAAAVKADLTALDAADSAHADNKAIAIDATNAPGVYRVDWPDAAFASGSAQVQLVVNGAAIDPAVLEVQLPAWLTPITAATVRAVDGADAALATPTNITAGTITTVTNLTNAPTNGDLTATMKTSVQTAATASLNAYDPPTNTELEARTLVAASYATPTNITAGTITTVTNLTNAPTNGDLTATMKTSAQTAATAALNAYDPPTNTELEARTLVAASYATPTNITAGTITTVTNLTNAPTNGDLTATMKLSINAEVDTALNTAIPGSPTADSINERIVAIDAYGTPPTATAIADQVWDEALAGHAVAGSAGAALSAATAPSAAAVADAVWDELIAGHVGAGSAGAALSAATAPSAATVADAVWDELIAGHVGVGSTAATLSAAGGAADPLLNAVPGAYAAGSAGAALGRIANTSIPVQSHYDAVTMSLHYLYGDDYSAAVNRHEDFTTTQILTGGAVNWRVRTTTGVIVVPCTLLSANQYRLAPTAAQIATIGVGSWHYNLEMVLASGLTVTEIEGTVMIDPDVR